MLVYYVYSPYPPAIEHVYHLCLVVACMLAILSVLYSQNTKINVLLLQILGLDVIIAQCHV